MTPIDLRSVVQRSAGHHGLDTQKLVRPITRERLGLQSQDLILNGSDLNKVNR